MKPPIADPFAPPDIDDNPEQWRIFRIQFWRYSIMIMAGALSWSLPTVWLIIRGSRPEVQSRALIFGLLAGLAIMFVMSSVTFYFLPVKVNHQKLQRSIKREIEWSQIQKVRFYWFFLPYAIISTSTKRNFITLPLFLRDMKGFARTVEEWAPDDNPLRLFLQKREF